MLIALGLRPAPLPGGIVEAVSPLVGLAVEPDPVFDITVASAGGVAFVEPGNSVLRNDVASAATVVILRGALDKLSDLGAAVGAADFQVIPEFDTVPAVAQFQPLPLNTPADGLFASDDRLRTLGLSTGGGVRGVTISFPLVSESSGSDEEVNKSVNMAGLKG